MANPNEEKTPQPSVNPTAQSAVDKSSPAQPGQDGDGRLITYGQANEILADLKTIKQRLLWVLIIVGFFAARALLFHY